MLLGFIVSKRGIEAKLPYTVLITKRKLRHYFESHLVTVVTSFPVGEVIQNQDALGRITKWALELMG